MARLTKRSDGRYKVKYHGHQFYGRTQKEAEQKRDDFIRAEAQGRAAALHSPPLKDYAARWLPAAKASCADRTYNAYAASLNLLADRFPGALIEQITPLDITEFFSAFADKSASYLTKLRQITTALFDSAVDDGYIPRNPCRARSVVVPQAASGTHRIITDEERQLILSTPHRMRDAAIVMLYAGLRRGEVIALTYEDIYGGAVHVTGGIRYDSNQPVRTPGKTANAIRTIPAIGPVEGLRGSGPVIPSAKGTTCTEIAFRRCWESYMLTLSTAAGHPVSIRCHDLRHSFVSWCCDNDVNVKTVMHWCGHADETMILRIYDHVTAARVSAEADKLRGSKWGSK